MSLTLPDANQHPIHLHRAHAHHAHAPGLINDIVPGHWRRPHRLSEEELYPCSDGEPMAESGLHAAEMTYAFNSFSFWLQSRPDAHVSMDTFFYFQKGVPSAVVSPDLYVVFGSDKGLRDSYKLWEEGGRLPAFVLEITSKSTRKVDIAPQPARRSASTLRPPRRPQTNKFQIYERVLRVAEYFLFDPTGDYLTPRLQGYRLVARRYVPIAAEVQSVPNLPAELQPERWLYSEQLGLALGHTGWHLRCYDPVHGTLIPRAEEAMQRLQTESQWRALAEERAKFEAQRANAEAQSRALAEERAEAEAQRANAEAQSRVQAEKELAQLRAELAALRANSRQ